MLRKVVVIGSGLVAIIPVVGAATPVKDGSTDGSNPLIMRPSELPIYDPPFAESAEPQQARSKVENSYIRSNLLGPVQAVREKVQVVWDQTGAIKHSIQDNYHELKDRSDWIVKYLREEDNKDIRYGAVAMGGLTGFIFGLRGGFIKRVFYAGLGTTAMGAICFPEETQDIAKNNGVLARQYINIAYNFLYGVKPGDPQLEVKFPELSFPKDFSEFIDLTVALASTVKQAVMPPPSKDAIDSKPSDAN